MKNKDILEGSRTGKTTTPKEEIRLEQIVGKIVNNVESISLDKNNNPIIEKPKTEKKEISNVNVLPDAPNTGTYVGIPVGEKEYNKTSVQEGTTPKFLLDKAGFSGKVPVELSEIGSNLVKGKISKNNYKGIDEKVKNVTKDNIKNLEKR